MSEVNEARRLLRRHRDDLLPAVLSALAILVLDFTEADPGTHNHPQLPESKVARARQTITAFMEAYDEIHPSP